MTPEERYNDTVEAYGIGAALGIIVMIAVFVYALMTCT